MLPDLPAEVLAVLRSSPKNLQPCEKGRKADIREFVEHVNEEKCAKCIAFYLQLDKELRMMRYLRAGRN
jgi:NifU-like protein involved in Fe-S cluster formation